MDSLFREFEALKQLRGSARLFELLRESSGSELSVQSKLRREFPDELVRAGLALRELREKARSKFSRAGEMWFDRKGLEQSTAEPVARHKAGRFHGRVSDYCCGLGADSIAMAQECDVVAVDVNPANCLRTKWNADVYEVAARVQPVCADVERLTAAGGLVHIDPDRRAGSQGRAVRVEDCVPALSSLQALTHTFSGGAIKLSPASNFADKFPGSEVELISLNGECKEATIWFGELAGSSAWRATVLPAGATLAGNPLDAPTDVRPIGGYVYDPDPAIVRAGLVDLAAERLGLWRLDDAEEYLTGDRLVESPFVKAFRVLADLPNNDREFRRYFRQADFGQVEIKCRHIRIDVESVRRKLSLDGSQPAVLIFARSSGKARAVVCTRL